MQRFRDKEKFCDRELNETGTHNQLADCLVLHEMLKFSFRKLEARIIDTRDRRSAVAVLLIRSYDPDCRSQDVQQVMRRN